MSITSDFDIAGNAHVPDPSDPPNMDLRNDEETINEHERLYSAQRSWLHDVKREDRAGSYWKSVSTLHTRNGLHVANLSIDE